MRTPKHHNSSSSSREFVRRRPLEVSTLAGQHANCGSMQSRRGAHINAERTTNWEWETRLAAAFGWVKWPVDDSTPEEFHCSPTTDHPCSSPPELVRLELLATCRDEHLLTFVEWFTRAAQQPATTHVDTEVINNCIQNCVSHRR